MAVICFHACYRYAPIEHQISPVLVSAIAFVCLNDLGVAIFLGNRTVGASAERLLADLDDESAGKQWQKGVILTLTMAFTTVLLGVTLKFTGASWNIVVLRGRDFGHAGVDTEAQLALLNCGGPKRSSSRARLCGRLNGWWLFAECRNETSTSCMFGSPRTSWRVKRSRTPIWKWPFGICSSSSSHSLYSCERLPPRSIIIFV